MKRICLILLVPLLVQTAYSQNPNELTIECNSCLSAKMNAAWRDFGIENELPKSRLSQDNFQCTNSSKFETVECKAGCARVRLVVVGDDGKNVTVDNFLGCSESVSVTGARRDKGVLSRRAGEKVIYKNQTSAQYLVANNCYGLLCNSVDDSFSTVNPNDTKPIQCYSCMSPTTSPLWSLVGLKAEGPETYDEEYNCKNVSTFQIVECEGYCGMLNLTVGEGSEKSVGHFLGCGENITLAGNKLRNKSIKYDFASNSCARPLCNDVIPPMVAAGLSMFILGLIGVVSIISIISCLLLLYTLRKCLKKKNRKSPKHTARKSEEVTQITILIESSPPAL